MLVERGTALTLEELGEKFLIFAQKSNSNTQAWELIDDRLDTFFGATLKVKIPNMTVNNKDPYFYVSFQHTTVTPTTYSEWILDTPEYYQSELLHATTPTMNISQYFGKNGGLNPFQDTGEFIAIGLHTLYDENLWMCEQGQITCEKEATEQVNRQNLEQVHYQFMEKGGLGESTADYLSFPGVGCPWLTISDKNKKEYVTHNTPIEYWFTKTDTDATITFTIQGLGDKVPRWQSISFGMMKLFKNENYQFPLYVAGGNQALSQQMYVWVRLHGSHPTYSIGNGYKLDMSNIALANSNLLYPTKFNGSEVSNFRILAPDGEWKDIFAKEQGAKVEPVFVCNGQPSDYVYYLGEPVPYTKEHCGIPFCSEFDYMTDTYRVKEPYNKLKSSTSINDIVVIMNNNIPYNAGGVMGIIPNTFYSWSQTLFTGEITIEGKKWLSVPNGWENRKKHYRTYNGVVSFTENDAVLAQDESDIEPNKLFVHNILIPLEDFDSEEGSDKSTETTTITDSNTTHSNETNNSTTSASTSTSITGGN